MRVLLIASPEGGPPDVAHADALVLAHPAASTPDWLAALRGRPDAPVLYVQVAPGASDLDAALAFRPDGIVLPRVADGMEIARLGVGLAVHEAEAGLPDGALKILAGLDGARALFRFGNRPEAGPRLAGLFCAFSELARDLGVGGSDPELRSAPLVQARGLLVLAAAAAGVPAFDVPCPSGDPEVTWRAASAARRDGFRGAFADSPAASAILARVFRPGRDDPLTPSARPDDRRVGRGPIRGPG